MQDIAENLNNLKGVIAAALIIDEDDFVTTLADDEAPTLVAAAEMIDEYFSAIQSVEKSYREIFFSIPEGYWVAFQENHLQEDSLQEDIKLPLILLKIEKKVNWPLISMGVKAAVVKLKKQLQSAQEPEIVELDAGQPDSEAVILPEAEPLAESTVDKPEKSQQPDQQAGSESVQQPPEPDTTFADNLPLVSIVDAEETSSPESEQTSERKPVTEEVTTSSDVKPAPKEKVLYYRGQKKVINEDDSTAVAKASDNKRELLYRGQKRVVEKVERKEEKKKPALAKSIFSWGSKKKEKEAAPEPQSAVEMPVLPVQSPAMGSAIKVSSAEGMNALQKQLSEELINFLGPAATFVFDDAVQKWRETYVQKSINLGYLVELVMEELDTEDEKQAYKQAAIKILNT